MTSSDPEAGLELVFRDVRVSVGEKQILKTVCGVVSPGQLMAVMGPSGKACGWIKGFCLIQAEYLSLTANFASCQDGGKAFCIQYNIDTRWEK